MAVDPTRDRKIFVLIFKMRKQLEDEQLVYPKAGTTEKLGLLEAREWAEQVVRDEIGDHRNPLSSHAEKQLLILARECVIAQNLKAGKLTQANDGDYFQPEPEASLAPRTLTP